MSFLLSAGCIKRPPQNSVAVHKITFEGNSGVLGGVTDYTLRGAMQQGQSERLTWLAPRRRRVYLDEEQLRLDGWRIETWYAHHGYYDARFLGWDVVTVRRRPGRFRAAAVRIEGRVSEGEPTLVGAPSASEGEGIDWLGFEDLSVRVSRPLLSQMRSKSALQPGSVLTTDALNATEARTLSVMVENTFARASVRSEVDVYAQEKVAQVRIVTEPGPSCTFGALDLSGVFDIPRDIILAEIAFEEGDPYKASKLAETQQRLFSLGVFSVVNVMPQLAETEGSVVPVKIVLTERKPQQLQVGGGFLVESNKQDAHTSVSYRHVNLRNRLIRFDGEVSGGYTVISTVDLADLLDSDEDNLTISNRGFVYGVEGTLSYPRAFGFRDLTVELASSAEKVIEVNYAYFSPEITPSLTYRISKPLKVQLSYGLSLYTYSVYSDSALASADGLTPEIGEAIALSELKQSLIVNTRDNPLSTRRGFYGVYELTEAGGPLQGRYSFLRLKVDQRLFFDMGRLANLSVGEDAFGNTRRLRQVLGWSPEMVIAGRIGGGAIATYGDPDEQIVPIQERLYLGGGSDVRGWSRNLLGPYVCQDVADISRFGGDIADLINDPDQQGYGCSSSSGYAGSGDTVVPIGGQYALNLSAELRRYFLDDTYGVAVFSDMGMVWLDLDEVVSEWDRYTSSRPDLSTGDRFLAPTVGLGLRYNTSIGPLRIDAGYRLDDDERFRFEQRLRFHLALGETF